MKPYQYILEPYKGVKSRHTCPNCQTKHKFTYYISTVSLKPLHHLVGRCERQDHCGYHYTPKQYFNDHPNENRLFPVSNSLVIKKLETPKGIGEIPNKYMLNSVGIKSNFVNSIISRLESLQINSTTIERVVQDYFLGNTKDGSVIFWQIDKKMRIRTGKIMKYDPENGKRIKNMNGAINWVHSILKKQGVLPKDYNLVQCLFGEHRLTQKPDATVILVESEKTAIYGALIMPEYIWLATGGKQNLTTDKCLCLAGRKVIVYPDLGAFKEWKEKARKIAETVKCKIRVSDLLEKKASNEDRNAGLDIADFLLTYPNEVQPHDSTLERSISNEISPIQLLIDQYPSVLKLIEAFDLCLR